jgi:hypothetical protein
MMKRMALSAFAVLCVAGTASAAPLELPSNSPVYFQFNNIEAVNAANNLVVPGYAPAAGMTQGNWGVFNISSVQFGAVPPGNEGIDIGGGSVFFFDDGPGDTVAGIPTNQGQITGIFYGVQINPADPTEASGGYIDLFWEDAATDDITTACISGAACGPNAATVGLFTDGTFLARLEFASGIDPLDPTVHLESDINPTLGGSGQADSFANVVLAAGGAWADVLDGNWFTTPFGDRDLRFSTFFNATADHWDAAGPAGTLGLRSNDPARVFTAPEPAMLTLLGIGLAGIAARQRRKLQTNR